METAFVVLCSLTLGAGISASAALLLDPKSFIQFKSPYFSVVCALHLVISENSHQGTALPAQKQRGERSSLLAPIPGSLR